MAEKKEGCVSPAGGVLSPELSETRSEPVSEPRHGGTMTARVGRVAIDFEAAALYQGNFKNIRLSEYRGKWIVLCFYPGDFTFV